MFPVVIVFLTLFFNNFSYSLALYKTVNKGIGAPQILPSDILPPEQWFYQKLDHFTPTELKKWKQRYFVNSTFYKTGGPVFLLIGGEGEASAKWMVRGQWLIYAQQYEALCFQLEHRFYGKSHPTSDTSVENLKYLSSEQALADIAYFINGMKQMHQLPEGTKWIAFGGSYPGSLAAWVRMKYPYLVHGSVSSSGPLLAKIDFHEYYEVVKRSLLTYSDKCANEVTTANQQISKLLKSKYGREKLRKLFKLCDRIDIHKSDDISNLFESLADNIAGVVQYNKDNRDSATSNITIDTICDIMTANSNLSVIKYADLNNLMLKVSNQTCLDFKYENMINSLQKVEWENEANDGGRQWIYQTCTEFGFYQTSSNMTDLFGPHFPVEFMSKQCADIFGDEYNNLLLDTAVQRTNILYGELSINVGNLVFVHGSIDPWHALGITKKQEGKDYDVIFIDGTAHCANMYPPSQNDSTELKQAREKISILIGRWLNTEISQIEKYYEDQEKDPYTFKVTYKYYYRKGAGESIPTKRNQLQNAVKFETLCMTENGAIKSPIKLVNGVEIPT